MQVFSEMAYERPDMEETLRFIEDSARKAAGADSYEKAREIFLALLEKLRHVSTMETIASIRNTADMTDVFYEKEMNISMQAIPGWRSPGRRFTKFCWNLRSCRIFRKNSGRFILSAWKTRAV